MTDTKNIGQLPRAEEISDYLIRVFGDRVSFVERPEERVSFGGRQWDVFLDGMTVADYKIEDDSLLYQGRIPGLDNPEVTPKNKAAGCPSDHYSIRSSRNMSLPGRE